MNRIWRVLKRTVVAFYDDQMTQHAAAMTYNAVISYLRDVVPHDTLTAIDKSLKSAIEHKGNATTGVVIGVVTALYGTTGVLESARRALNVAFQVEQGRSFVHRKLRDVASTFILMGLVLITLVFVFVGGKLADHIFGASAAEVWNIARWPLAVVAAMFAFAYIYYVTPDLEQRQFKFMTPGAATAVIVWIVISWGFSQYLSHYSEVNAIYGTFAGAIILVGWVWLTNVSLLFGAELNSALNRERESRASGPDVAPAPR
jgi:membrane protein